jgi:protein-tyrosine phosphatase
MYTSPFWIEGKWSGRLAVSPRPRGGDWLDGEMKQWRSQGIDVVASLLMPEEVEEFELANEQKHCEAAGMSFASLNIIDRNVPGSMPDTRGFVRALGSERSAGRNVLVHCRQGIGRSGLIAAAVLMESGKSLDEAIMLLTAARGREVPETAEQLAWLRSFAVDFR